MEPKKAYASIRKNSIIFQLGHEKQTKKNPVKFFEMSSSTEAVYINNKKKKKALPQIRNHCIYSTPRN